MELPESRWEIGLDRVPIGADIPGMSYRVVARSLTDGSTRVVAEGKTERDAEAIVTMAVMRRGVDEECFYSEPDPPGTNGSKKRGR